MMNDIEIIGTDHGWMNMKTASTIFTSGVNKTTEPAFFDDMLEFEGNYYKIGSNRLEVNENKVGNENYYLLTLAAMAKELKKRNKTSANVVLSVGLPITKFAKEKADFISYLSKHDSL